MFNIRSFLTDWVNLFLELASDRVAGHFFDPGFKFEATLIKPTADITEMNVLKMTIKLPTKAVPYHMWPSLQKSLDDDIQLEKWHCVGSRLYFGDEEIHPDTAVIQLRKPHTV